MNEITLKYIQKIYIKIYIDNIYKKIYIKIYIKSGLIMIIY